jgi:hypothetical protein
LEIFQELKNILDKWQTDVKTSRITSLYEVLAPTSLDIYKGLNFEFKLHLFPPRVLMKIIK